MSQWRPKGSNYSGSNRVDEGYWLEKGFDFGKYRGLFFDQLSCSVREAGQFVQASMS